MRAFYFKHSGRTIDVPREMLWPDFSIDKTFKYLWLLVCARIQNHPDLKPEDIIDIGFPENKPFSPDDPE